MLQIRSCQQQELMRPAGVVQGFPRCSGTPQRPESHAVARANGAPSNGRGDRRWRSPDRRLVAEETNAVPLMHAHEPDAIDCMVPHAAGKQVQGEPAARWISERPQQQPRALGFLLFRACAGSSAPPPLLAAAKWRSTLAGTGVLPRRGSPRRFQLRSLRSQIARSIAG